MPLPYEKGVAQKSELYDATASKQACAVLYYLQRAGHFYCDTHYTVERDSYPSFLLLYVLRGEMEIASDDHGTARVRAGELAFLNCYQPHAYHAVQPLEYLWLHFDGANTVDFYREILQTHGAVIRVDGNRYLLEQMQRIVNQMQQVGQINEVTVSQRLHTLLCGLLYTTDRIAADHPLIAQAQRYLHKHLREELSVAELAQQFHLSASQMNRLFRASTGQSPHEYLINLRINRAKTLLKETQLSVIEIAGEVGYAYDTSFAAAFRAKTGMSPRQFRNMPV